MKTFILKNGATKIIKFECEMDESETRALKFALEEPGLCSEILIDLTGISFVSSGFVGILVGIKQNQPLVYEKIKLLNPGDLVREMLALTPLKQMYEVQKIYPTVW